MTEEMYEKLMDKNDSTAVKTACIFIQVVCAMFILGSALINIWATIICCLATALLVSLRLIYKIAQLNSKKVSGFSDYLNHFRYDKLTEIKIFIKKASVKKVSK